MKQFNPLASSEVSIENNQKVIAVIDDDLQISQALGAWFHIMGVRGSFHSTAESFLDALVCDAHGLHVRMDLGSRHAYVLAGAIVDLNLPGIHGVRLIQKLHQLQPTLPLVLITALREDERTRFGDLPSGVAYVKKPFNLDTLEQALFGHSKADIGQAWLACNPPDVTLRTRSPQNI